MSFTRRVKKFLINGRGHIALSKNKPEKAMSYFLDISRMYPNNRINLYLLLEASYKSCNWDAYTNVLKLIEKNTPGDIFTLWSLGTSYLAIDRPEIANKYFDLGIQYIQNQNNEYLPEWILYIYKNKAISNLQVKKFFRCGKMCQNCD